MKTARRRSTSRTSRCGAPRVPPRLDADSEVITCGQPGHLDGQNGPVRAFGGLAPDLFAGDAAALGAFRPALYEENRLAPEVFTSGRNFFALRNVTAIIGEGPVRAWATVSLHGHAIDVMLSLLTDTPLSDGATLPVELTRPGFPYSGAPYSAAEQEGVAPARPTPHPA